MKKTLLLCFALMGLALQSHAQTWAAWTKHYFHSSELAFYSRACDIDLEDGQYKHLIQFTRNTNFLGDIYIYSIHLNGSNYGDCYIGPDYQDVTGFWFIDDTSGENSSDWNFFFRGS